MKVAVGVDEAEHIIVRLLALLALTVVSVKMMKDAFEKLAQNTLFDSKIKIVAVQI